MAYRYSRSLRLTKAAQFSSVFSRRCLTRSLNLSLFAEPNVNKVGCKLGMTVGRRLSHKAVVRNYMKRVIREIFRKHKIHFDGVNVIVQPRRVFGPGSYQTIESELLQILQEARRKCLIS